MSDELAGVRELAVRVHPELQAELDRLVRFQGWQPPQYARVGDRQVRIG